MKSLIIGFILEKAIKIIGFTCRIRIVRGEDILKKYVAAKQPVVYCFWHNRVFFMVYFLGKHSQKKGLKITALVSQSKDGEFISRVVRAFGGRNARGSSSRGGMGAIKTMLRCIKDGYALAITPDGPRGPVYQFQSGAIYVASAAGIPIVPVTCTFEKAWVFRSWDRFMIPKPFSRVDVYIENPVSFPRAIKAPDIEKGQEMLREIMTSVPELMSGSVFVDGEKDRR